MKAKDLFPYVSGGLTLTGDKVMDGYGGQYITDWLSYSGETKKDEARTWLITYKMPTDDRGLKAKLETRAKSTGLIFKKIQKHGTQPYTVAAAGSDNDITMIIVSFE